MTFSTTERTLPEEYIVLTGSKDMGIIVDGSGLSIWGGSERFAKVCFGKKEGETWLITESYPRTTTLSSRWTSGPAEGESKFEGRLPHVERIDGADWWVCDGRKGFDVAGAGALAGVRFEEPEKLSREARVEDVRPGGYIPEEHIKDMDIDGIDVSIVYPSVGLLLYSVPDGELLTSAFRTYNDWLAEFCGAVPKRLKGIAMLNIDDVQEGVKELERCANLGFVGAMTTIYPPENRSYDNPEYEPLWAAAQDLRMPLSLHIGTNRPGPSQEFQDLDTQKPAFISNADHWVRMSLAHIIFSGVFERYPKLQVGSVEQDLAWVPFFLNRIDYTYTQRVQEFFQGYRFKEGALPATSFTTTCSLASRKTPWE